MQCIGEETMSEAIKRCPFCGGKPMLQWVRFGEPSEGDQTYVKCVDCHARSAIATNEVESNAEWNRRTDSEEVKALKAEIAELESMHDDECFGGLEKDKLRAKVAELEKKLGERK